jgi:hypothetical protein
LARGPDHSRGNLISSSFQLNFPDEIFLRRIGQQGDIYLKNCKIYKKKYIIVINTHFVILIYPAGPGRTGIGKPGH